MSRVLFAAAMSQVFQSVLRTSRPVSGGGPPRLPPGRAAGHSRSSWLALFPLLALGLLSGCGGGDAELDRIWVELRDVGAGVAETPFDPAMVEELPDPARRFLLHAIAPGTVLAGAVELDMSGSIAMVPDEEPLSLEARQVLAPPHGFIWLAVAGGGLARIRGYDRYSDGQGEMRWELFGFVPVVRASGEGVTRSAAGRLGMEAVLVPATLIPGSPFAPEGLRWEEVDEHRARFHFPVGTEVVEATLEVDAEGRPLRIEALRWAEDAEEGREPGYEPFVVEMSGEFSWDGYTLPAFMEAGWRLGAPDEFRFFGAELERVAFH